MLYGIEDTTAISRTGPYGARNGPIGPVWATHDNSRDFYMELVSESCICPTFSHGLQKPSKLVQHGTACRAITNEFSGSWHFGPNGPEVLVLTRPVNYKALHTNGTWEHARLQCKIRKELHICPGQMNVYAFCKGQNRENPHVVRVRTIFGTFWACTSAVVT